MFGRGKVSAALIFRPWAEKWQRLDTFRSTIITRLQSSDGIASRHWSDRLLI
jgi:hypothetical protein